MSLTTYQPVRLAPAVLALITTPNQTITNCGPFAIQGRFIKSSLGIIDWPQNIYFSYYRATQSDGYGFGYGYNPGPGCFTEQTVIGTLRIDEYGTRYYTGEIPASECEGIQQFILRWNGTNWEVAGLYSDGSLLSLVGGTERNPLLARGEQNISVDHLNSYTVVTIGFAVPLYTSEGYGYGYGYAPAQFQYTVGYGGVDEGYGILPAPGEPGSIQVNDGNIPQSQAYTDNEIVEVEIEIVDKNGVHYVPVSNYDRSTGNFTYYFVGEWNDAYEFRARGFSENHYATSFGNTFTLTLNVAPSVINHVIDQPLAMVPGYGQMLALLSPEHDFKYQIDANCYGTHSVLWSLDSSEWQEVLDITGSVNIKRMTQGLHTLALRTRSNDGQYSNAETIRFFVSLSTYVTIDDYPVDPLCGPGRTATISGTREAGAQLIAIYGIIPETLRLLTSTTWEADIYVLGTEKQIIDITVENFAGRTANARQEIYMRVRPPKIEVRALEPLVYINKAFVQGYKDPNTNVSISHNNGPWTEIIEANSLTSFQYVIELVSGENRIDVKARETDCDKDSDVSTITTTYVDPTIVSGAFQINNGDNYTVVPLVILTFASTTASKMKVSNFEDFREGYVTEYKEQLNWFLLDQPGISRVYVQFYNDQELSSIVYTDEILLTASNQINLSAEVKAHQVHSLQATDTISGNPLGTVVQIVNLHNSVYEVRIFQNTTTALAGAPILATATTQLFGRQTLLLVDAGSGSFFVVGTITITITEGAPDVYLDHRTEVFDITTGQSTIPLEYQITQDADYFYAMTEQPYYESKFVGQVKSIVAVNGSENTTVLTVDKVFTLLRTMIDGYGYGYGYGYGHFAQAMAGCPSSLNESLATYPLDGMRLWYPTLSNYASVTKVEEFDDYYRLTIDQAITNFVEQFACRLEFSRQNKFYTDYRIRKADGVVEFLNESTYATGNIQVAYEYNRPNKGRPDGNWYRLCGLKFNDLVTITIPQTENKITFAQLNQIKARFYNGDEGVAPAIVRFIIYDSVVYEDRQDDIIEGPTEGYSYGYSSSGYGTVVGAGDQIVEFVANNTISNDTVIQKVVVEFRARTNCMYLGEVRVMATAIPLDTNCRVTVNGEQVFAHSTPIGSSFDSYEIRLEKQEADIWYNGAFVHNIKLPTFDPNAVTTILGSSARTANDQVKGAFQRVENKKYYDTEDINVGLIGRVIAIEPNLRKEQ